MARVRRRAGTKEALQGYRQVLSESEAHAGGWSEIFDNDQPIMVEIGIGRGRFISTMAKMHPEYNFVGVEIIEEMVLESVERMEKQGAIPDNLRLLWLNAELLTHAFAAGEVARIYLNFSDPWPKYRHRKRRLTHERFLAQYADVLMAGGEVHQKTDNQDFFAFSLNSFADNGWRLQNVQLDLYKNLPPDNIATEYESKFVRKGLPIYRLEAVCPMKKIPENAADFLSKVLTNKPE